MGTVNQGGFHIRGGRGPHHEASVCRQVETDTMIAVFPEGADPYGALIYPLDKGRSRRHLVDRVVSDVKIGGKRLIDDMPQRLSGPLRMALQKLPDACR